MLELDDIQSGVLRPRPSPYAATYVLFRIDDRRAGRELMRRFCGVVASAAHPAGPAGDTWVSVAVTYSGLSRARRAARVARELRLGVPAGNGRARRRARRHRREQPELTGRSRSGSRDVHVIMTAVAPDRPRLEAALVAGARCIRAPPRRHRHLAAGLPRARHRARAVRVSRRDRAARDRRQRPAANQSRANRR